MAERPKDLSTWLPSLIGPLDIQTDGDTILPRRQKWNFEGATVTDVTIELEDGTHESYTNFDIGAGGGASSVAAGDGVRVTTAGTVYTVHGNAGTCMLEMFDAAAGTGNASADGTAWAAAFAALAAGTYKTLLLGAKTYLIATTGVLSQAGTSVVGHGYGSVLQTTEDIKVIHVTGENTLVWGFRVEGDNGTSAQCAVQLGTTAGTMPIKSCVGNVHVDNMYYGFRFIGGSSANYDGPSLLNCHVTDANIGIATEEAAEYVTIDNCHVWGSLAAVRVPGSGIDIGSGNIAVSNSSFTSNVYGCRLRTGTNDAHGTFVGCHFNHNASPVNAQAILYGHTFTACHMYGGEMWLNGSSGVTFNNCTMNLDAGSGLLCNSAVATRFVDCLFATNIGISIDNTSAVVFTNPRMRDTNEVPGNIGAIMQQTFTFASDANATLTLKASHANTLLVQSGVITASRQITSTRAPSRGTQIHIRNANAQGVTYRWASGTAVTIATGEWAIVGADGTNAIVLANGDATGGGGTSPGGSTGDIQYNNAGAFGGLGGSNGQFMRRAGGAWAAGNEATFVGLGTTPATVGDVRIPNAGTIQFRNAANTANYQFGSIDSAGNLFLGDSSNGTVYLRASVGGSIYGRISSTDYSTLTSSLQRFDVPIAIGPIPASTGTVRLPIASTIMFRNNADTANYQFATIDVAGNIILGDTGNGAIYYRASVGGQHVKQVNGVDLLTVTSSSTKIAHSTNGTRLDIQAIDLVHSGPIVALATANVPWSVHGDVGITMASANKTLTNAENARQELRFEGTFTAMHTVTIASVSGLHGYTKDVWINASTDFGIVLTTGAGKTVSLKGTGSNANVCRARIMVSGNGVVAVSTMTKDEVIAISNL